MSTTALVNIQLASENQITPSQLWPDWNSDSEADETEPIDPSVLIEQQNAAIEFLNNM